MSELALLLELGDEKGLAEFFGTIGWKKEVAAIGGKEFLKAFEEIKEDKAKKERKTFTVGDIVYDNPLHDGEPTTADKYNEEWLDRENKKKSRGDAK